MDERTDLMYSKQKHGGTRQGSGAPLKYGEPLKHVSFRIPVSQLDTVKCLVKNHLKNIITVHHNVVNSKG